MYYQELAGREERGPLANVSGWDTGLVSIKTSRKEQKNSYGYL